VTTEPEDPFGGSDNNAGTLKASSKIPSLLAKYKSTEDESERSKIAKELTVIAGEEFDARQAARDKKIDKLELQVKHLREIQAHRAKEKEEIVKDHVRLLLRSASGLGWSSDGEEPGTVAPKERGLQENPFGDQGRQPSRQN